MSHEFSVGFSVREPAWHGLATIVGDYPGREEGMKLAGHDFTVVEKPIEVDQQTVTGWKALVRDDQENVLHVMPSSYGVVQPSTVWDIVDAMFGQDKDQNLRYETAGVLKGGRIIWVLVKLDEPVYVKGDTSPTLPFGLVSNTYDGSAAVRASATSVRVICWNTYSMSMFESARTNREFSFRHTANIMEHIADAKLAIQGIRQQHLEFIELAQELVRQTVSEGGMTYFVNRLIPMPEEALVSERVKANIDHARQSVWGVLNGGVTVDPAVRNTAYGLLQAGVEYVDHLRPHRNRETYFGRTMLRPERVKANVVLLAREAATL